MEIFFSALGVSISFLLFLSVLILQYINRKEAIDQSNEIEELLKKTESDSWKKWKLSAGWDMVMDRFDRLISPPLDNLRRFSNAALVIGIGGTMGIFFAEAIILLFAIDYSSLSIPSEIIPGMIVSGVIALLSSLLGIGFHLNISLKVLGGAQESIISEEKKIDDQFDEEREGDSADEIIKRLNDWLEGQTPDFANFTEIVERLLKEQISLNSSMDEVVEQMRNAILEQKNSAKEIEHHVEKLTRQVETFLLAAKSYIGKLSDLFEEHQDTLSKEIIQNQNDVRDWLKHEIDKVIREIYESLGTTISESIVHPLERMGKQLNATTNEMPLAAREFGSTLHKLAEKLEYISATLEKFPDNIDKAVSSTISGKWSSIYDEMKGFNTTFKSTAENTHEKLAGIVEDLVILIKKLIREVEISKPKKQ